MGKFEGVAEIEFDCQVAVVSMKPGAKELTQDAVTTAITDQGWGLKDFKAGLADLLTLHLFQLSGTKAEDHAALAKRLLGEIKGAQEVVIDSGGRAVVTLGKDGQLTEESLGKLLKAAGDGWTAKNFETRQSPKSLTTYVVDVPGMASAADAAKVHEALKALPKVLVAQVFQDTKTAQIRLREPCSKIADDVTAALKAKDFESTTRKAEAKASR